MYVQMSSDLLVPVEREHGLKTMLMIRYDGFGGGPLVVDSFRTEVCTSVRLSFKL
jgi:hypothetical protein